MGLTVAMIIIFGIAAVIPAAWSIIGLIGGEKRYWPGVLGAAWAVALLLVTFIGAGKNWGDCPIDGGSAEGVITCATGDTAGCKPDVWALECGQPPGGDCTTIPAGSSCPEGQRPVFVFCEKIQHGGVKQPWATWSDLSFIAAGLWLLWFFHYFGRPGRYGETTMTADNPMIVTGWLSVVYGMIVIFMGPPSQWFHASMKDLGGWFDSMSVVIWLMFNGVYVTYNLLFAMWGNGRETARTITVLVAWVVLVAIFGIIAVNPDARLYGYFASGGLWGVAEVIYVFVAAYHKDVAYRRTWWLFVINIFVLAVTMTIWVFFNDEVVSPTACQGREGFPGHAVFHILASFSTVLTFMSFASEQRVNRSDE